MLKSCLFGATNIIKNSANSKHILSGYGIKFDRTREQSFDDDFAKNVDDIDDSVSVVQKKFSINFTKAKIKLYFDFAQHW